MPNTARKLKIIVQLIIFNGETLLPPGMLMAWLKQADKIADKVFITEGATLATTHYWDGRTTLRTKDGKSTDNTISIIKQFIANKPKFHLKEADSFWNGKTSMLNYWMNEHNLEGYDYLWQIDGDEFYKEDDIDTIIDLLASRKPGTVSFYANHFWGDYEHLTDERSKRWANEIPWKRIFKIDKHSKWVTHEPPCLSNEQGGGVSREETLSLGVKLYHYSYVTKEQIEFKSEFYNNPQKLYYYNQWVKRDPNERFEVLGCDIHKFDGQHPMLIRELINGVGIY